MWITGMAASLLLGDTPRIARAERLPGRPGEARHMPGVRLAHWLPNRARVVKRGAKYWTNR